MRLKKFLAAILSVAMLAGIFPATGLADYVYDDGVLVDGTTFSTLPTYTLGLYDTDFNPITADKVDKKDNGDPFYLGIKMTNFDRFVSLNKLGLTSLNFKIRFASDNLACETTNGTVTNARNFSKRQETTFNQKTGNTIFSYQDDANHKPTDQTGDPGGYTISYKDNGSGVVTITLSTTDYTALSKFTAEEYLAFIQFNVTTAPAVKKTAFEVAKDSAGVTFATGTTGQPSFAWESGENNTLDQYLVIDESAVDIFTTNSANLDSIDVKVTNPAYSLPPQYKGEAFKPGTPTYVAKFTAGDDAEVAYNDAGIKYYYGATDDKTSVDDLTAMPAKLPTDNTLDDAYAYVAYTFEGLQTLTKVKCLGKINPQANSISTIDKSAKNTYVGETNLKNDAYKGKTIDTSGLQFKLTYASSTSYDPVDVAGLAEHGLSIYAAGTVDGNTQNLVAVPARYPTDKSTFTFIVCAKDKSSIDTTTDKFYKIDVTLKDDQVTIDSVDGSGVKKVYGEGKPIDLSKAKVTYHSVLNDTPSEQEYANAKNDIIFYYAPSDNNTYAANSPAGVIDGDTKYDSSKMAGKNIYAVPANNTSATPVLVAGPLADRAIAATGSSISLPTGYGTLTYGQTIAKLLSAAANDNMSVTLKYDNNDTETFKYDPSTKKFVTEAGLDLDADEGVILVTSNAPTTAATDESALPAKEVTLSFVDKATKETTYVATNKLTVAQKEVKVDAPSTGPSKTYDGDAKVTATVAATLKEADMLSSDATDITSKVEFDPASLKYVYNDKNVGDGTKTVSISGTPAPAVKLVDGVTDAAVLTAFNDRYKLVLGDNFDQTSTPAKLTAKGTITAKPLTITKITPVQPLAADATDLEVNGENTKSATSEGFETNDVVDRDEVTISYTATYNNFTDNTQKVEVTNIAISGGADKDNYDLQTTSLSNQDGTIASKILTSISVTEPDTLVYTYPNVTPDKTGFKVVATYVGGGTEDVTNDCLLTAKGNTFNWGDLTVGQTAVSVSFSDDSGNTRTGSFTLTVNPKQIKLSEITFNPTKTYGDANASQDATFPSDAIENTDDGKVKITYTTTFATEDVEYNGSEVANKTATISKISLAPVTDGDDTYKNYVIVDDRNEPATVVTPNDETTITTTTAKIEPKRETAVTEQPVVTIDPATNHIKITSPTGDNLEYSVDGTNYYSQEEFEAIDRDFATTYNVTARVKKSDDNHAPSEPTAATSIKTLQYRIDVRRKGFDTVTASGYTDKTTVSDASAIHDIIGGRPASFQAYYTDAETTAAVEYDFSIANAAKNNVVELYYKRSSGGGGGGSSSGSSSYTVKFDAGENGVISSGKASVSVNKNDTVPETSVPTVTAKTGYTFVGWSTDGSTIVDPTEPAVTKGVTYTAVYEEITVPTQGPVEPTPTDAPVIDENFTKPYASGYEDGSFRPDGNITRAELAAMIARLSYGDDLPDGVYYSSFSDVDNDAWFAKYVGYLEDKDVLSGYEDGTFRPYEPVTRGEISAVITRAQRLALDTYTGQFVDVTDSDWAKDYIQTLADNNIASGYEDGTFGPYNSLTRAEAVTMINKVLAPSEAVVSYTPNDIAGHWAYDQIILAVNERRLLDSPAAPTEEPAEEPETVVEEPTEEPEAAVEESTEEATEDTTENTTEAEAEAEAAAE